MGRNRSVKMFKKLGLITLSFVLFCTLIGNPLYSSAEETNSKFICLAAFDENKVLLSWEDVPFADSYEVQKNNMSQITLTSEKSFFLDTKVERGKDYTYRIIAKNNDDIVVSESLEVPVSMNHKEIHEKINLKFKLEDYMYWVNGEMKGPMSTPPTIKNGRSFLVIRYITEVLNAEIMWEGTEKKVTIATKDENVIELWIGKPVAKVNGEEVQIDADDNEVVPFISEGRTLLPLRFVSESLGANDVLWDGTERSITLLWEEKQIAQTQMVLGVEDINNLEKNIFKDSVGNKYAVEGFPMVSELTKDDSIIFSYGISDLDTNLDMATIKITEFSKVESEKKFTGVVVANEKGETVNTLKVETGEDIQVLYYDKKFNNLCNVADQSWVMVEIDVKNDIKKWGYLRNQIHEDCIEKSVEFTSIDYEATATKLSISPEYISSENVDRYFIFENDDEWQIEKNTCYKINYKTNWLGRNIVTSIENMECPCEFEVTPIEIESAEMFGGTKNNFTYELKNTYSLESRIETFAEVTGDKEFPGTIKLARGFALLEKNGSIKESIIISPDKEAEGEFIIKYGARCREFEDTYTLRINITPDNTNYEIILPEKVYGSRNSWEVNFEGEIINNSEEKIDLELYSKKLASETVMLSKEKFTIAGKSKEKFEIKIDIPTSQKTSIGDMKEIVLFSKDYVGEKKYKTKLVYDIEKHPIVDVETKLDKSTKTVTLNAEVNWEVFKADHIEVKWGDGSVTKYAEEFPLEHKYKKDGLYNIEVTAYTTLSKYRLPCQGWGYKTIEIGKTPSYPKLEELNVKINEDNPTKIILTCNPKLYKYTKGDIFIHIRWGDGYTWGQTFAKDFNKTYPLIDDGKLEYQYQKYIRHEDDKQRIIYVQIFSTEDMENPELLRSYKLKTTIEGSTK